MWTGKKLYFFEKENDYEEAGKKQDGKNREDACLRNSFTKHGNSYGCFCQDR